MSAVTMRPGFTLRSSWLGQLADTCPTLLVTAGLCADCITAAGMVKL